MKIDWFKISIVIILVVIVGIYYQNQQADIQIKEKEMQIKEGELLLKERKYRVNFRSTIR